MRGNWIKQKSVTTGISDITLTAFGPDFPTFLDVFAVDTSVDYCIRTGNQWEEGLGIIRAGGILERTRVDVTWNGSVYDDTTPAPITIAADSTVFTSLSADSILDKTLNLSDLDDIPTAKTNLGLGTGDDPTFNGVVLPVDNDPVTPTIRFGAGNDGIFSSGTGNVSFSSAGFLAFTVTLALGITSGRTDAGGISYAASSATTPSLKPWWADSDTGVYGDGADLVGLTAGGIAGLTVSEVASVITINAKGDINIDTIGDKLSFGDGDTWIQERIDDSLSIHIFNGERVRFNATGSLFFNPITGSNGGDSRLNFGTATSATVPGFNPVQTDTDTGVGSGGVDQVNLIAGAIEGLRVTEIASTITINMYGDTNFPFNNDAATPTINFGNGNTGFYESADDWLAVSTSGISRWVFQSEFFQSNRANFGAALYANASSLTFPAHTFLADTNTGMHRSGDDQVSLVAGGIEGIRVTEVASAITINLFGDTNLPFVNDSITPVLNFGDGDTGFYESSDDNLRIVIAASAKVFISGSQIQFGSGGSNTIILYAVPTATAPGLSFASDANTGVGRAGDDQLSLIAGGIQGLGIDEGQLGTVGTHLFIPNLTTAPTSDPTGGGALYTEAGALKYRGSGGTITTIANA